MGIVSGLFKYKALKKGYELIKKNMNKGNKKKIQSIKGEDANLLPLKSAERFLNFPMTIIKLLPPT